MPYLIALVFAVGGALATSLFLSGPAASWVVAQFAFESPDEVSDLYDAVFMGLNIAGLALGWIIGYAIGAAVFDPKSGDPDSETT